MQRLIAANWKMHGTQTAAAKLAATVVAGLQPLPPGVSVVLCPAFTALERVGVSLAGTGIGLGAQNVFWEDEGAFTGEVSPLMLSAIGCTHVIVGHSERRALCGETDAVVARKLLACWRHGLFPVLCVGETTEERAAGTTEARLRAQLTAALGTARCAKPLAVAYEPVWAIGGGRAATPADCAAGLGVIRAVLRDRWEDGAARVPCLYGGSVNPANCRSFWEQGTADGALVGGASLDPTAFAAICRQASQEGEAWSR